MIAEIISIILSSLLSLISVIIALKSYKQGNKQLEISNKQSIFNNRCKNFEILNSLYELYINNEKILKDSFDIPEFIFSILTNNDFLLSASDIINKPFGTNEQNTFLIKLDNLRVVALEISLLWDNKESKIASDFIYAYVMLLVSLYNQYLYVEKLKKKQFIELEEIKEKAKIISKNTKLDINITIIEEKCKEMIEKNVLQVLKDEIKLK